ncbi:TrbI/VirB10 family protein [Stenotrophomonas maltophilia]|jgi:type IV secretion system protein VirB10|uniref:TrbI/VirB10 family protein n=1 Tax=Stenotrophomonas TaxID=40323 RepID=UPI000620E9F7|nr:MULTISPECIES: TrbI/VirB10 family protein [unclassified Stenotrophomonas]KKF87416.1 secretion protein [Stenotrophomonas maltophilia]MBA0257337.1 TrbI/VirB10 family protein [Stenotrophomonas maltophilia]MBA0380493.1 TrbI/VirB10 family protein [Stenotrophomonas maltophilia]MBA0409031.1 TrbI/VirB10 family protein [Stenotrophomonas maltophilia]MBA0426663.1 TrbI/VirB10 family protein [Stenotrophomonas maltophilia]
MSQQNTPGNDPNNGRDESQSPYGAQGASDAQSNPYFGTTQAEPAPDLDAAAPQLRSAEEQRLNRKALLFLGGIVVLLVAMGFLLFRKGQDDKDAVQKVPDVARVSTPTLPDAVQTSPVPSQAMQPVDPIPMTPPLPPPPLDSTPLFVPQSDSAREIDRGPTLLDRRIGSGSGVGGGDGQDGNGSNGGRGMDEYTRAMLAQLPNNQAAPAKVRRGPDVEDVSSATYIQSPDALLVRGTYLRCVLETRIITDLAGYTSCLLTEPVYSINGRNLLLPKGSKIYGAYGGGPMGKRVEVIWDRITTPNGIDVAMSSPGVDQLGGAGHPGQYSAHWGSRIASALMISLISDAFKYAAAEHGPETTTIANNGMTVQSPYESATARTMERLANEALSSNRRPPTVTINQGTIVNVYVAKDVDFTNVLHPRR